MRWARTALAAGFGLILALTGTSAALATTGQVLVSNNGVSYSTSLPAPIFDSSSLLVPMHSISGDFWVRNASTVAAYLRLTLEDATWSSVEYGAGLSLSADVPGRTGVPVNLTTTAACNVILYGELLAPGASVKVTTTMSMADADGTDAQSGWAAVGLGVTLIEAAGLSAASDCSIPTTPVVVVPKPGTPTPVADGDDPDPDDGEVDPTPEPEPGGFLAVLTNTLVHFDARLLGVATASVPIGAGLFFLARRFGLGQGAWIDDDDDEEDGS